jgi:hypothetical protein
MMKEVEQENKTTKCETMKERGGGADRMWQVENEAEDGIKTDEQEQAMPDSLQLCLDEGSSLQLFNKRVAILCGHGKKERLC